ncbi:hypothetical protein [Pseudobutyrivibrio ruminis]|uniref:Uncharacterized protein n=1 Tax=Pseudobutyrivibrio ruminis DSM 9787 TaxID=1123011 RepID=A0A285T4Q3_9FIRM|nr:hypothetical protein [Pseudobutyrivibrio ruminis]SOC16359.1 hypothetical protein SAMN02910411_0376 [Pseudobutyrivibrio ruminis DSM 9787]
MSKADLLLKAQNSKRTLPKRDALPPTKTVLSDESTIIEKPTIQEEKPAPEAKPEKKEPSVKSEQPKKETTKKKNTSESKPEKKVSKNEGTINITVKYFEALDQEFFNAQATLKGKAKWQYLQILVEKDMKEKIDRTDDLHKEIKFMESSKPGNLPVTEETKQNLIKQAAMHSFSGVAPYVAYLVRKERLATPGWN